MGPQAQDERRRDLLQPAGDKVRHGPKGSTGVRQVVGTYLLPVGSDVGLRLLALRWANASSTGAAAYE